MARILLILEVTTTAWMLSVRGTHSQIANTAHQGSMILRYIRMVDPDLTIDLGILATNNAQAEGF